MSVYKIYIRGRASPLCDGLAVVQLEVWVKLYISPLQQYDFSSFQISVLDECFKYVKIGGIFNQNLNR